MPVVEVTEALDGVWRTVVDLNQVSTGEILTIDNFAPSPDGRKLLIGWGIDGRECAVLRVIGVDSGEWLTESVRQIRPMFPAWLLDSSGFYYAALDPAVSLSDFSVFRLILELGRALCRDSVCQIV